MVDISTAIKELNNGDIEFSYKNENARTTEGEVVILLNRLKEFDDIGLEPFEIRKVLKSWLALLDSRMEEYTSGFANLVLYTHKENNLPEDSKLYSEELHRVAFKEYL